MSSESSIEWTDATWNPVTGCDRVSPGCAHCYALELAPRLRAMGNAKYVGARDGGRSSGPAFGVTLHEKVLEHPLRWRKPRRVFVNSMSDLFHDEIPELFIARVFGVMGACPQHTFQVLTKRPERMAALLDDDNFVATARRASGEVGLDWPLPNVWLGVSIENRRYVDRADLLRATPAAVRFISAEPLLGPLVADEDFGFDVDARVWSDGYDGPELDLTGIDWLIVGGESGPNHRPISEQWVRDLRDACQRDHQDIVGLGRPFDVFPRWSLNGTAFFFKQWGGRTPKAGGRELDRRTWDEFPPQRARPTQPAVYA